jgi:hypothetical protein
MRFYFEDHIAGNVATKCLRISSTTTTGEVIETLSEKFRPDMKMLNTPYFLFEVHANKGKMDGWIDRQMAGWIQQLKSTLGGRAFVNNSIF